MGVEAAMLKLTCSIVVPLELLTMGASGLALGKECHVQWEWPDTASASEKPAAPPEGGAILFAWSFGMERGWAEMTRGAELKIPKAFYFIIKFVTPVFLILILFASGGDMLDKFFVT